MNNKWLKIGAVATLCLAPLGILSGCTLSSDIELAQEDADTLINGAKTYLENEEKNSAEESEFRQNIQDDLQEYLDRQIIISDVKSAFFNLLQANIDKQFDNTSMQYNFEMTSYDAYGRTNTKSYKISKCVDVVPNETKNDKVVKIKRDEGTIINYLESKFDSDVEPFIITSYTIDTENKIYTEETNSSNTISLSITGGVYNFVDMYRVIIAQINEKLDNGCSISVNFIDNNKIKFSFVTNNGKELFDYIFDDGNLIEFGNKIFKSDYNYVIGDGYYYYTATYKFNYDKVENLSFDKTGYTQVDEI